MTIIFRLPDDRSFSVEAPDDSTLPRKDERVVISGVGYGKVKEVCWVVFTGEPGGWVSLDVLLKDWKPISTPDR